MERRLSCIGEKSRIFDRAFLRMCLSTIVATMVNKVQIASDGSLATINMDNAPSCLSYNVNSFDEIFGEEAISRRSRVIEALNYTRRCAKGCQ